MNKKTIKDVDISGKRVFVRVDFNVPIKNGKIEDDTRIRGALPTIEYAVSKGARIILASHLGRPLKDKKKAEEKGMPYDAGKYSLRPVYEYLRTLPELQELSGNVSDDAVSASQGTAVGKAEIKNDRVFFVEDCVGATVEQAVERLQGGQVLLLENLRLHAEEEKNDAEFSKQLASLCDVYVNDAFGTAHRAHASTEGITHHVGTAVAGLLMEKELEFLGKALDTPERPFVAILGGAKVSDKILIIENLLERATDIIIGGGMAYTFMKAQGGKIGNSLCEEDRLDTAKELLAKAEAKGVCIHLPADSVIADKFDANADVSSSLSNTIPDGWMGLDIGPMAIETFTNVLHKSKTILWNGPMGVFEMEKFQHGTKAIADAVAEATENGAYSLVGGGDSVAAVNQLGLVEKFDHVSTGGHQDARG